MSTKKIKSFCGNCPTLNKENTIDITYIEYSNSELSGLSRKSKFSCDNIMNCPNRSNCPIFHNAPKQI